MYDEVQAAGSNQYAFSLGLVLYLVGLVLAQTPARYYGVLAATYFLLLLLVISKKSLFISRPNLLYYTMLLAAANISSFYGGAEVFLRNLVMTLVAMVNMLIYEFFAEVGLRKEHVRILIWVLMVFSLGFALLTSSLEKLYFINQNSVPLLMLLLVYLCDLYLPKEKTTIFLLWCFALIFTFLSESRAGLFALLSYLVLRKTKSKRMQVFLFGTAFITIIVLYVLGYSIYLPFTFLGKPIAYLAKRELLWSVSFEVVRAYPFGLGYIGYASVFEDVLGFTHSPHNTYLNIIVQFGWIYFALYIYFILRLLRGSKLNITTAIIFSIYLRAFFESGIPFGFGLSSALLLLPFYLERGFLRLQENGK